MSSKATKFEIQKQMNSKMKALTVFLALSVLQAVAQSTAPKIKQKQAVQQKRIENGVKSGELNPTEAAKLNQQQAKIQQSKKQAKADGVFTPKERAKINKQQQRASKNIARQKKDTQR